jgi:phosphocarrier protein
MITGSIALSFYPLTVWKHSEYRVTKFPPQMTAPEADQSNAKNSLELIVENKMGIHARPAAMIVRVANTYSGEVWVEKDDERVNGKSIMGLMMLAAGRGSKLTFLTEGPSDSALAMLEQLSDLFKRRFEEA